MEKVVMYRDTSIKKENAGARTMHVLAKAVHSGQPQRGGEE